MGDDLLHLLVRRVECAAANDQEVTGSLQSPWRQLADCGTIFNYGHLVKCMGIWSVDLGSGLADPRQPKQYISAGLPNAFIKGVNYGEII